MTSVLNILTELDTPWSRIEPIRVGPFESALQTPDRYVVGQFGQDDRPLRLDICFDPNEYNFKFDAIAWRRFVVLAVGESLYLFDSSDDSVNRFALCGYFCDFTETDDLLLVASAEQILAIDSRGLLVWRSEELGIDGVLIHETTASTIRGSGEWDPPGGWEDFVISLHSGRREG